MTETGAGDVLLAKHPVMKRLLIDIGIGFCVVVLWGIAVAVMPLSTSSMQYPDQAEMGRLGNLGFLFSAIPVFLITVVFALAVGVRGRREGVRRGFVWAGVFVVCVLIMVIGNQTFYVFGSFVYVPVAATALGPIVVGLIRRPAVATPAQDASDKEEQPL